MCLATLPVPQPRGSWWFARDGVNCSAYFTGGCEKVRTYSVSRPVGYESTMPRLPSMRTAWAVCASRASSHKHHIVCGVLQSE